MHSIYGIPISGVLPSIVIRVRHNQHGEDAHSNSIHFTIDSSDRRERLARIWSTEEKTGSTKIVWDGMTRRKNQVRTGERHLITQQRGDWDACIVDESGKGDVKVQVQRC